MTHSTARHGDSYWNLSCPACRAEYETWADPLRPPETDEEPWPIPVDAVEPVRESWFEWSMGFITVLARRFGVDPSTARDVLRGKTWVAPIDERRLAGAWLRALGRDHDEKCLVDDGTGGCPVGAEIADLVPKVIREYQRLSDTGDTPDGAS